MITIIVILILTGIAVVAIKNTKILDRAKEAKVKTTQSQVEEQMKLLESNWQVEKNSDNKKDFEQFLKEKCKDETIKNYEVKNSKNNNKFYIVYKDGYITQFNSDGMISGTTEKEENGNYITSKVISKEQDKSRYYGKIVKNYECTNSKAVTEWKIFYSDENNIYLIAGDFINYKYCPLGKNGTAVSKGNTEYCIYLNNMSDYSGSDDIVNKQIQNLNKNYFDYLNQNSTSSTYSNMRAVAYLLDIDAWKVFAGDNAEYAIGTPTYELLFDSYNQTHNTNYQTTVISNVGYQIRTNDNSNWEYFQSSSEYLNSNDNIYGELYVIKNTDKASCCTLASPSGYDGNTLPALLCANWSGYSGRVSAGPYLNESWWGLRPVVCLKTTTKLKMDSDGNFLIK